MSFFPGATYLPTKDKLGHIVVETSHDPSSDCIRIVVRHLGSGRVIADSYFLDPIAPGPIAKSVDGVRAEIGRRVQRMVIELERDYCGLSVKPPDQYHSLPSKSQMIQDAFDAYVAGKSPLMPLTLDSNRRPVSNDKEFIEKRAKEVQAQMDANTPKGQEALAAAREAFEKFERHYGERFRIVPTDEKRPAKLDGLVMEGDKIIATVEVKVRDFSYQGLRDRFGNEWLLSFAKLKAGMDAQELLGVGMLGLLYCKQDGVLLVARLLTDDGAVATKMRLGSTETRATVNGGTAVRNNLYIDMDGVRVIS